MSGENICPLYHPLSLIRVESGRYTGRTRDLPGPNAEKCFYWWRQDVLGFIDMNSQFQFLFIVVTAIFFALIPQAGEAATIDWDVAQAVDSDFSNPLNWVGGIVPGPGDTASLYIIGTEILVIELTQGISIAGLAIGAIGSGSLTLDLNSQTLTVTGEISTLAGSTLRINGGTLGGVGDHTIGGTLKWDGGTLEGTGSTTVNGVLDAEYAGSKYLGGRSLVLAGVGTLSGGALTVNSALTIAAAGSLAILDDSDILGDGSITVFGALNKEGGLGISLISPFVENHGQVWGLFGDLSLQGGGSSIGNLAVSSGASLTLDGSMTVLDGGLVHGFGDIFVEGEVTVLGGWELSGGLTVTNLGTMTLSGAGPYSLPDLTLSGRGKIGGTAGIIVTQSFYWAEGTVLSGPPLVIGPGAVATFDTLAGSLAILAREITIQGYVTSTFGSHIGLDEGAGFTVSEGATWEILNDISLNSNNENTVITNYGTLLCAPGSGTNMIWDVLVENHGLMQLDGGIWETRANAQFVQVAGETVLSGGSLSATVSSRPVLVAGGILSGEGTIDGDLVTSNGMVAPGALGPGRPPSTTAAITVTGDYRQAPGIGGLHIDALGFIPISEHDQLIVFGDADLTAGRITYRTVGMGGPYHIGDTVDVISCLGQVSEVAAVAISGFAPCTDVRANPGVDVLTMETVPSPFCDGFESGSTTSWD